MLGCLPGARLVGGQQSSLLGIFCSKVDSVERMWRERSGVIARTQLPGHVNWGPCVRGGTIQWKIFDLNFRFQTVSNQFRFESFTFAYRNFRYNSLWPNAPTSRVWLPASILSFTELLQFSEPVMLVYHQAGSCAQEVTIDSMVRVCMRSLPNAIVILQNECFGSAYFELERRRV